MSFDAHKNFASSFVLVAPSPANTGTSLTVNPGGGALFPAVPFNAVVCPANTLPTPFNAEIVRVTNIAGDVLTITRAQESSTAQNIAVGYYIADSITAKDIADIEAQALGGTVTSISIASSNGFAGSSSGGATPILTLQTSITGILYGNGTAMASAVAANFPTLNQDTTGAAAKIGVTDDTTTNATMYPTWVTANSGNLPVKVASTKLGFNPSTNAFFVGTPSLISTGGAGATPIFQFASAAGETGIGIYNFNNGDGNPAILRLFKSNGGTVGAQGAVVNSDIIGQLAGYGSDGVDWCRAAAIRYVVNGSVSSGHVPTDMVFYTSTANSFTEGMRLTSGLNFLLGTSTVLPTISGGSSPILQFAQAGMAAKLGAYAFGNDSQTSVGVYESYKSRGTTIGSQVAVISGDSLGQFTCFGSDGTNYLRGTAIRSIATNTFSGGSGSADLVILTSTANSFTETARFKSTLDAVFAGSLTLSQTGGLIGTTTNNNANAGSVGELITGSLAQASALSLTTDTDTDITSISLTPGDWEVSGQVWFRPNTGTVIVTQIAWVSSTSATIPGANSAAESGLGVPYTSANTFVSVNTPIVRFSLTTTTTVYLSCRSSFSASTSIAFGNIRARRAR